MDIMRGQGTCYKQAGSRYWWIQYWHEGKRFQESSGCEKLRDAQTLLHKKLLELKSSARVPGSNVLIRDLFAALEMDYTINKKKSIRNVRAAWQNHLAAYFGNDEATAVSPDKVSDYIAMRQKEGAKNASINRELSVLKRCYTLGIRTQKLTSKPYIPFLQEDNVRFGTLSAAQYEVMAIESGKIGLWFRALFETAYTHGLRKTALLEMRVQQIDLERKTITMEPGSGTKRKPRLIVMTNSVYELLRQCCAGKSPDNLVFTRSNGSGIADFRRNWKKVTDIAGCPELLFHDLRRTALTNMIEDGVDEKTAMRISGHITRSVFDRYHIVKEGALREAAAKTERGARERHERELFDQGEMFENEQSTEPRKIQ